MSRTVWTAATVAAAAAFLLTGCGQGQPGADRTEEREIAGVSAVLLSTDGRLVVEQGEQTSLTVTAGQRVLPHLTSEVHDGVLTLDVDEPLGPSWHDGIEYRLVVPRLDAVSLDGSGDVEGDGLATGDALAVTVKGSGKVQLGAVDVDDLTVVLAGSGDVELTGRAERADITLPGSGSYLGNELATSTAAVTLDGSGNVDLDVSEELTVVLSGSGVVSHTGGAEVTSDVDGSGKVVAR